MRTFLEIVSNSILITYGIILIIISKKLEFKKLKLKK